MDNQKERLELESVPVHHLPAEVGEDFEELYFPINHNQVRDILGKILTHIEAINLPAASEKANKAIFTQMVWRWFDSVMDNSATSAFGCIAPIKIVDCSCDGVNTGCKECTVKEPIKVFRYKKIKGKAPDMSEKEFNYYENK